MIEGVFTRLSLWEDFHDSFSSLYFSSVESYIRVVQDVRPVYAGRALSKVTLSPDVVTIVTAVFTETFILYSKYSLNLAYHGALLINHRMPDRTIVIKTFKAQGGDGCSYFRARRRQQRTHALRRRPSIGRPGSVSP